MRCSPVALNSRQGSGRLAIPPSLANELGEQRAPDAAPAQETAPNQGAHDSAIPAAGFHFGILALVLVVLLFISPGAFAHEMRGERPTDPATAEKAAGDEEPKHTTRFVVSTFLLAFAFFLALVLVFMGLSAFAQKMSGEQAPHATAP